MASKQASSKRASESQSPHASEKIFPKYAKNVNLICFRYTAGIDEHSNEERFIHYILKGYIDCRYKNTWISRNAVKALCTLPCTSSNPQLFDYIFKLNRGTRACMKSEWQYKRWNNIYPSRTKCFRPGKQGDCEICCIPKSLYQLDDTTWKKQRCIICHCNKEHTHAMAYSIHGLICCISRPKLTGL